jgi:hypothetical protein
MLRLVPFALLLSIAFTGCKKALSDVKDYYPEVRTASVSVNTDGSVTVAGEIVSEGDAPLDYAGACVSTSPVPTMEDGQVISAVAGDRFTATYTAFDPYTRYYFRTWAINKYGYSYGNVIALDSIAAQPVNAPCSLAVNSIDLGSGFPTETYSVVNAPEGYLGVYSFTAYSNANNMTYRFGGALHTGIYTTTQYNDPSPGEVRVSFFSGFINASLSAGTPVYVTQLSPDSWAITICQAPWAYNANTYYLNTSFTCPN